VHLVERDELRGRAHRHACAVTSSATRTNPDHVGAAEPFDAYAERRPPDDSGRCGLCPTQECCYFCASMVDTRVLRILCYGNYHDTLDDMGPMAAKLRYEEVTGARVIFRWLT
jgi:hypothetical protein